MSNATRLAQLPALPTIAETYPGYAVETWNGLVGPAGMPEAVLARLADEGRDIVADPAFRARLEELGITPYGEPPSAFGARIKAERNLWQPLLAAAGIEPQ
ncbi:tripartite tricarboxylate transporter substrate-binding protein [Achromobacter xylosoxidans]